MIELLLPCGFDTLEYSWVKTTIVICTPADYSVAKKLQHTSAPRTLGNQEEHPKVQPLRTDLLCLGLHCPCNLLPNIKVSSM
jgi:hypothetical protein